MTASRREFIKTVGAAIASSQISPTAMGSRAAPALESGLLPPQSGGRRKVIYDQDNSGPFGTDILGTLIFRKLRARTVRARGDLEVRRPTLVKMTNRRGLRFDVLE